MLQFDEYKVKLNNLLPQLDDLEQALNLDERRSSGRFLRGPVRRRRLLGQPRELPESPAKAQAGKEQAGVPGQAPLLLGRPDGPVRDGQRGRGRVPPPRIGGGIRHPRSRAWSPPGSRPCSPASTMPPTPFSRSMPAQAAPRPRTGHRCSTGCTPAGPSATASPIRSWTIRRATRPA